MTVDGIDKDLLHPITFYNLKKFEAVNGRYRKKAKPKRHNKYNDSVYC